MKNIRLLFFFIVLCSVTIAHAATGPLHYATFDGSTGYVAAGNTSIGNFGTGTFTLEAWIKTTSTATQCIVGKRAAASGGNFFQFITGSNSIGIELDDNVNYNYCAATTNVHDGNWHHVACYAGNR